MADGLDQAADAFRNEIAPNSERPRDDSGRFTQASRPEPLFAERPVEGDPRTGDVRDGGEDARLAARERRVADGWLDERQGDQGARPQSGRSAPGGDQSLSDGQAGPRSADGEGEHQRTLSEQTGGDDKPLEHDKDGEGADEGPDAEGTSEQDAEDARWALTHDGKPVDKIEIDVGGETKQVSLKEVLRGYAEQETLNKRAHQFEEHARAFEQQSTQVAQEIGQARQTYQQRLEYIGRVMADLYPKELNWSQEYAADPRGAHEKEEVYKHVRGRMTAIAGEMQREQAEAKAQYDAQMQHAAQQEAAYAEWGKREFARRSGLQPDTINNEYAAMRKAALEHYDFTEQEVGTVFDPRMLLVLRDASLYRRALANKPRPVMPETGRALAPGAARPFSGSARRGIDDALKKQARTGGSIDATAAVFERLIR